jgi:hypothetical protein
MVRPFLLVLGVLGVSGLFAQELGRTDRLWRDYLSETVRRGLPLLVSDPVPGVVPFWPALDQDRADAQILEPSDDLVLLGTWIDRAEGAETGVASLKAAWPKPTLRRFSVRQWGECLFTSWDAGSEPREWTDAWLAWTDKVYSPIALTRGLQVLETQDPSSVVPLATQALELYPEDRRFLPFVVRHPELAVNPVALITRDLARNGGWSDVALKSLLDRAPNSQALLVQAGYNAGRLVSVLDHDYGVWVATVPGKAPAPGAWTWDSDQDGLAETNLVFDSGGLASWSRSGADGRWTLGFRAGAPETLRETRSGSSWTLRWEAYPWASQVEYRWGDQTVVYRFRPLTQSVPLWPEERFKVPSDRWPVSLAALWLPVDPRALALSAATVETWVGNRRIETVFLYRGEVWLDVADSDHDGVDDTWSYYRSGRLASVYRALEGRGQAGLRELYHRGELAQVQSKAPVASRTEFALFPAQGVQLWDPHGDHRPLERVFLWTGGERLGAVVFSKDVLPWETMPTWEPRP